MALQTAYSRYFQATFPAESDVLNTASSYTDGVAVFNGTYDPGAGGTVPAASDVRFGVAVGATTGLAYIPTAAEVLIGVNVDQTVGTVTLPVVGDVRDTKTFGPSLSLTGVLDLPSVNDVRLDISFDQTTKTGNVRVPPVENVLLGYAYDTNDTLTGTLGTGAGGYPSEADVRLSVVYGDSSQFTGLLNLPDISDVRLAVSFDDGNAIGNCRVPPVEVVQAGYDFDTLDSLTGTLNVTGGQPAEADVRLGTIFGGSSEFTGALDLPSINKVRAGVEFDSTTKTGNSVMPPEARVLIGTGYGSLGTEFTGSLDPESGTCTGYPLETEVLAGTVYGEVGELTGNRTDAQETDVRLGVQYAANGVSKTGTWNGETGDPGDVKWIGE